MIRYKYNFGWDIFFMVRTIKKIKWLKEKKLVVFFPNFFNFFKLIFNKPKSLDLFYEDDIICYWISSGTWGAYRPPNKIFICPWHINKAGGLEKVIKHEIAHLKYFNSVSGMNH